jgi:hypothetical protein
LESAGSAQGYGCAGGSQKQFCFVAVELARVDASFCTFFGVRSGLAMGSSYFDGSEEQKQKWLPPMARWEKIGCFGLTEPLMGSRASGGLTTTAKRSGEDGFSTVRKDGLANAARVLSPHSQGRKLWQHFRLIEQRVYSQRMPQSAAYSFSISAAVAFSRSTRMVLI